MGYVEDLRKLENGKSIGYVQMLTDEQIIIAKMG
jgi:hypothetical protein